VKWVATRTESLLGDNHGRDQLISAEMALDMPKPPLSRPSREASRPRRSGVKSRMVQSDETLDPPNRTGLRSRHLTPESRRMQRILVVDDDRTTRDLLRLQLKSLGYGVDTAADGASGLARLERRRYDLVLLDVWMPGMDGLEVLGRIRSAPAPPPVVVMTADDAPQTVLKAIRERAYRYVTKPIEPKDLGALVSEVLSSPADARPIEVISAKPEWVELLVPCDRAAAERIQAFLFQLESDLPEDVRVSVGQAFRELLMNAIEWGGGLDPRQTVRIACLRAKRMILFRIADPGKGFSFSALPHAAVSNAPESPLEHALVREEKGLRPGGFGLLMTRQIVDELVYNEAHNEVVFVKYLD
jgi:CheY-like chemotaxis protein